MVFGSARAEVLPGGLTADRLQAMWIGVALAVTGGMVILLTKLVMLRPLRQLERHAMRLLGNDMVVEDGWPDGRGELGRLARVFQHVMRERAAIQKSGDELFLKMQAVMSNAAVGIAFTRLSHWSEATAPASGHADRAHRSGRAISRRARSVAGRRREHGRRRNRARAAGLRGGDVSRRRRLLRGRAGRQEHRADPSATEAGGRCRNHAVGAGPLQKTARSGAALVAHPVGRAEERIGQALRELRLDL